MLIDTHCHLYFDVFAGQVDQIIRNAESVGVTKIIVPGVNLTTSQKAVDMAKKYDQVYAVVGIHPSEAQNVNNKSLGRLKNLAENDKVVGIGECGLDYKNIKYQKAKSKDTEQGLKIKERQKEVFRLQIGLAQELDLPLVIHGRNASEDILKMFDSRWDFISPQNGRLQNNKRAKGVFHCFSGNFTLLNSVLEHDFYIGIDGNVTYSKHAKKIVKRTPLEKLLVETDSPLLMPEPIRSRKEFPNEPKNVKIVAEKIAKICGDSFLKVAKQTSKNARELFNI